MDPQSTRSPLHGDYIDRSRNAEELALRLAEEIRSVVPDADPRCVATAITNIEQGFLWLRKSIGNVRRIKGDLPIDLHLHMDKERVVHDPDLGTISLFYFDGSTESATRIVSRLTMLEMVPCQSSAGMELFMPAAGKVFGTGCWIGMTDVGHVLALSSREVMDLLPERDRRAFGIDWGVQDQMVMPL